MRHLGRLAGIVTATTAIALAAAATPVLANLSLILFGPKDWPSTLALVRAKFPLVRQQSADSVASRLASPAPPLLVDTRTPEEFAVSHLAGAVNASSEAALARLAADASGREIVVYCSVGYRSSALAQALIAKKTIPPERIVNLEGSIFAWANDGRALVRRENGAEVPAATVHPYNRQWAKLLRPERVSP